MAAWIYLFVSLVGAWFTWNAHFPRRSASLGVPSFFAGWLTAELATHHIAWQALATLVFARRGALRRWPGKAGLLVTLASWVGLGAIVATSRRAKDVVEDAVSGALGPDFRDEITGEQRAMLDRPALRSRSIVPFLLSDPGVSVIRNIRYAEGAKRRHLLDVYHPKAGTSGAPVLLQVHGGGWTIGDKAQQALPLMNHLTSRGWVCVAANYRLSPKATFPDHLVDLKMAIAWIRSNIAEFGGDPDFVCVTGGSAGGHLTAMLGLTAGDPEYQPGFEDVDTSIAAAVPFYGIYDFTNSRHVHGNHGMGQFIEHVILKVAEDEDPDLWRRSSPMFRVRPDAPPFLVIHGTHDTLAPVGEAREFVAALRDVSRSPVAYAELEGAQHAFEVFHSPRTAHVVKGVSEFLCWAHGRYSKERRSGLGQPRAAAAMSPERTAPSTQG